MLIAKIESILFIVARPLSVKKLAEFLDVKKEAVETALAALAERLNTNESGLRLVRTGAEVQIMTSPEHSKLVREFVKDEVTGELTRPQLETLTVIAYRQPITKPELEQIRGVNCSLIIRNLLMRGLIETDESSPLGALYRVTHDFMRFLGITHVRELPEYDALHAHEQLAAVLERTSKDSTPPPSV